MPCAQDKQRSRAERQRADREQAEELLRQSRSKRASELASRLRNDLGIHDASPNKLQMPLSPPPASPSRSVSSASSAVMSPEYSTKLKERLSWMASRVLLAKRHEERQHISDSKNSAATSAKTQIPAHDKIPAISEAISFARREENVILEDVTPRNPTTVATETPGSVLSLGPTKTPMSCETAGRERGAASVLSEASTTKWGLDRNDEGAGRRKNPLRSRAFQFSAGD